MPSSERKRRLRVRSPAPVAAPRAARVRGVRRVVVEDGANGRQPGVGGGGQLDGLLGRGARLVTQDGEQPSAFGSGVVGGAGVGEDQLAQQRADGEDGGGIQAERVVAGGQADQVQIEVAVGAMGTAAEPGIVSGTRTWASSRRPAPASPRCPRATASSWRSTWRAASARTASRAIPGSVSPSTPASPGAPTAMCPWARIVDVLHGYRIGLLVDDGFHLDHLHGYVLR